MKAVKITALDKLFSDWIRTRDGWKCQRCKTQYTPPTNGLQCSHFWGRSNKATRYDPENCDALCAGCHMLWEPNKHGDYRTWKIKQLGKKGYDALEKRARSIIKFGAFEMKQKLAELKNQV